MPIVATDWTIDESTKIIQYTGAEHTGAATYATVIEFHRWLQELADDAVAAGDDELDITKLDPSRRSTDNIITLINGYTLGTTTKNSYEFLYDGSIIQNGGDDIWDGIVNFGNSDVIIQIIQDGAVISDSWWNDSGGVGNGGVNADAAAGISHRFMIQTKKDGADIDGRRLIGTCRTFGNTYSEFSINGTSRGNNVLALSDSNDLNNETVQGTVAAWDQFSNTNEGYIGIDLDDNGADEFYYSQWDIGGGTDPNPATINDLYEYVKNLTRDGSASSLYGLNGELFRGITHEVNLSGGSGTWSAFEPVEWTDSTAAITAFADAGDSLHVEVTSTAHGLSTSDVVIITGTTNYNGTFPISSVTANTFEIVDTWVADDATGTWTELVGTGQMLAVDNTTATSASKLWLQILSGVAPGNTQTITGTSSSASNTVSGAPVDRSATISTPFIGASTGSALIGAYGVGLDTADAKSTDIFTDLGANVITPPNFVTNTVSGLVSTEDRVLVAPTFGTDTNGDPAIDKNQFEVGTALTTDNVATVTIQAGRIEGATIPSDTPSTGHIRVVDDNGFERRLHYTAWSGSDFTIDTTDGNEDFLAVNASQGNNVYIAYIDELASGTTAAFTSVQSGTRNLVVIVRDGGGSPIKQFISAWSQTDSPATLSVIRTTDA